MYIQKNTFKASTGKAYNTILLCEKYHEDGKVKTRTILNLKHLPEALITSIENTFKSKTETVQILKFNETQKKLTLPQNQMLQTAILAM